MATAQQIANAIAAVASTSYTAWRIGLTHDLVERKAYWASQGSVSSWRAWEADTLSDAQAVESHFINERKMKGGTGGDLSARKTVYVYIF
jgi:hypothetical protein